MEHNICHELKYVLPLFSNLCDLRDFDLEVSAKSSAEDFLKILRSNIFTEVILANSRANRVSNAQLKIIRENCLSCPEAKVLPKCTVCEKCPSGI